MATGVEAVASASCARSKKAASDAAKHISQIDVAIDALSLSPLPGDGQGEPQHRTVPRHLCQPRIPWHVTVLAPLNALAPGAGPCRSGQIGVPGLVSPLPGWRDGVDKLIRSISSVDRAAPAVGWSPDDRTSGLSSPRMRIRPTTTFILASHAPDGWVARARTNPDRQRSPWPVGATRTADGRAVAPTGRSRQRQRDNPLTG